ncbi:MAG: thioredoxin-disulfide reductase [Chlamydiota bacterium]
MELSNLVIIGSGPAGYAAAIYAARSNLQPILYEGFLSGAVGGQLTTTTDVENFPGFPEGISGPELMEKMRTQALRFATTLLTEDVTEVDFSTYPFIIKGSTTTLQAKAVIIATGAVAKKIQVVGSEEFWQKGISACAVCDGASPIFRGKDLFVVGGGDTAVEEALFLTKYAAKVYIIHRRDTLRASKIMADRVLKHPKIEVLWNRELQEIRGKKFVEEVVLYNNALKKSEVYKGSGLFYAIGHTPNTAFLRGKIELTEEGYIVVKKGSTYTSVEGVFAAGDVQDPVYRQAIVAAGSGCMAALDVDKWFREKG